ncbi:asparaginase [Nocardioides sp. Kera G14]|uniref:asparaginase n=1 Tax=Nocardioides sp. Kera G14 TaxID=2884264 RepID=UPI001D1047E1|nr:asparaginase [Nocardioides sp. Kera G14]UDY23096.1 asparaginase [Nocardioides sp. Kera G14]
MAEVLAEIVRSGFVEGHHYGSAVTLSADGDIETALGDPGAAFLPRSANKPLQALAMLGLGLGAIAVEPGHLAITCASHSGEEIHLRAVRELLGEAGLSEQALGNIVDWPLDPAVRDDWVRAGRKPSRIAQNCSGKHAGMLATCVARDWQLSGYFEHDHPLQVGIKEGFERITGEPAAVTTDGCGAPLLSVSLVGLAKAFRSIALAGDGDEWKIASAIRSRPELVSGTGRDEFRLLTALPGTIGKLGAEAVYVVALPDGRTAALKIDDGGDRARPVVMAALLRSLGVESDEVDASGKHVLLGGGVPVGEIRAVVP